MKVSPARLKSRLEKYGVPVRYVKNWDSPAIDPYRGKNDMQGIVLHHTAGVNSENYICFTNPYAPVRAAHFLVNRDGTVVVCSGSGAYHAGEGGPWAFTKSVIIPKDGGNSRLYGIEIESLGTSPAISGTTKGMTVDQVVSTALLCVALLDAMAPTGFVYRVGRVIRHKDWAPTRKIDVKQDLDWWREAVEAARKNRKDPARAAAAVRKFVSEHPKGKI
jgi:N-acetyl-anhydromuramyl-L-alanine amidase AmpD